MPGEFSQQYSRVIGKDWQDVLTPPGMKKDLSFHNVWKMPLSWSWQRTGHSGGYWQQSGAVH